MWASQYEHSAIVAALLQGGAAVNAANNVGTTALMYAAFHGHPECARLLLEAGADKPLRDNEGTALGQAGLQGHAGVVALLQASS
eukprot:COSAG04_NODE_6202_length_1385_cov_2.419907_3_plen_85_part_00